MADKKIRRPEDAWFIGVDGGGTKTIAWLGKMDGQRFEHFGTGTAGPSNPLSVGYQTAFDNIQASVDLACEQVSSQNDCLSSQISCACLSLAGFGRPADQEILLDWGKKVGLAKQIRYVSEAEAVLAALSEPCPPDCGDVVLICGTGSIVYGLDHSRKKSLRCGGWGYLLGDEGSGFWLGQQLLQLLCRVADGRLPDTGILDRILAELQLTSFDQLVDWTYQQPDQRQRIAKMAKLMFREAELIDRKKTDSDGGEPHSPETMIKSIIRQGASELVTLVATLVKQLSTKDYRLTMAGGILCNQPSYCDFIEQKLVQRSCTPVSIQTIEHPVSGALKLAREMVYRE